MDNKLVNAGKQLIKGNLGNALAALSSKSFDSELIQPSRYRNGSFFFGVNGADKSFIWGNYNSSLKAYQKCPIVSSIINRKAQCFTNGEISIIDADGKTATTAQAKALSKLLKKPNRYQSGLQFRAQVKVYQQIYGYCPILKIKPVGFESDYSKWKLFALPPWMIQVLDSTDLFYEQTAQQFRSITLTYMGQSVVLNQDNVFFLKENQISTSTFLYNSDTENASIFLPDSKLFSAKDSIENIIDSLNSRGSLTRERGPQWILTNDGTDGDTGLFPIDPEAKKELHDDFRGLGIMRGQKKAIITDAKLKLQTVGFNVAELKLLEGELQDAKIISDCLNYPPYLLGLVDAKFDNQEIAERNLYINSIIPDSKSDDEQWSELFGLDVFGLSIKTDYSHLPALQENLAELGKGLWYMNQGQLIGFYNNVVTLNQWRQSLGIDIVEGDDKYYSELLSEGKVFGMIPNIAPPADNKTTVNTN